MPQAEDDASLNVNLIERKTVPTVARQAIWINKKEHTQKLKRRKHQTKGFRRYLGKRLGWMTLRFRALLR